MTDERFSVLVVCHANLCRSPMAERLAHRLVADRMGPSGAGFEFSSAGTHARPDLSMHPYAAEVLSWYGAHDAGFASRKVTAELVAGADLVLTATRAQRAACVSLAPGAVRRTFTLLQFGRLAAALHPRSLTAVWPPQQRLRALIDEVPVLRSELPVAPVEEDDLADPVREPLPAFRRCAREIQWAMNVMIDLIGPI